VSASIGNGFQTARMLLRDRSLRSAFCIMNSREIIDHGLPAEHFDRINCLLPGDASRQAGQELDDIRTRICASTPQIEVSNDIMRLIP
jgi:hypothetical protein